MPTRPADRLLWLAGQAGVGPRIVRFGDRCSAGWATALRGL